MILVVKGASSTVAIPFVRPGPCSAIEGGGVREASTPGEWLIPTYMPELFLYGRGVGIGPVWRFL